MSRPLLRWVVPIGVALAVFGVGTASATLRAAADRQLPARSAAQLLVDLQTARLDALSGTVVLNSDLGLPALPGRPGGSGSSHLESLVAGSHTLRVWYAGPDKVRVALLGTLGESDVIRNGRDVWVWSSEKQQAVHRTLPPGLATVAPRSPADLLPITPQEAADKVLAALDPTTVVSTAGTARVAGRAAYELVIAPRDAASLVSQVRIAVDGERHVPLRAQVFAKGRTAPAFEVGFQQISFDRPADDQFRFTPPPGTSVTENGDRGVKPAPSRPVPPDARAAHPTVVGSGWTSVLVARVPAAAPSGGGSQLGAVLSTLPRVSGEWGAGRLLSSRLFTVLLTDDGRLLAGAVGADRLYQVAAGQ
jgi:outer membrane lipoprotein-sorting protein